MSLNIQFNNSAIDQRIEKCVNECIEKVKANAAIGIRDTELYFPRDIHSQVVKKLEESLPMNQFVWKVLYKGYNEYGILKEYTSETFMASVPSGDVKKRILRYIGK